MVIAQWDKDNSEICRSVVALNNERTLQDEGDDRNHRSAVEPQTMVQITEVRVVSMMRLGINVAEVSWEHNVSKD